MEVIKVKTTIVSLLSVAAVLAGQPTTAASDVTLKQSSGGYCSKPDLRDYEKPLKNLPPVNSSAFGHELPFAPSVELRYISYPANRGRLIAGSGIVGAEIVGPAGGVAVAWRVVSRLVRMTPSSASDITVREAQEKIERVSSSSTLPFVFQGTPGRPGSYRYDIEFFALSGEPLGKYSRYLQVLRPKLAFHLGVRRDSLRPGRFLYSRWGNQGSELIEFSLAYWIERWVGGRWKLTTNGPRGGRGFLPKLRVGAGATSHCMKVWLPSWLPKGLYRLGGSAGRSSLDPGSGTPIQSIRTVDFRVS
jgi:hypothetical protein